MSNSVGILTYCVIIKHDNLIRDWHREGQRTTRTNIKAIYNRNLNLYRKLENIAMNWTVSSTKMLEHRNYAQCNM